MEKIIGGVKKITLIGQFWKTMVRGIKGNLQRSGTPYFLLNGASEDLMTNLLNTSVDDI